MIQPPKMSPLALTSAGSGITRSTSSRSSAGARALRQGRLRPSRRRRCRCRAAGRSGFMRRICGDDSGCRDWRLFRRASDRFHANAPPTPRAAAAAEHAPGAPRSDWAHAGQAAALPVALQLARGAGARLPGRRQGRQRRRAAAAEAPGRRAVDQARRPARRCWWCRSALLVAYGALRLSTSLFTELRELIFAKATEGTARSISLQVFRHLHALSLRFHLERQTGGMTRDIERGTRAVHSLISYFALQHLPDADRGRRWCSSLLAVKFDAWFAGITLARAGALHRLHRHASPSGARSSGAQMNELDSTRAVARHRRAAQLRDGQVLQQRGLRGPPLRREPGEAAPRGAEEPDAR